jgi:hypothetical protein
MAVSTATLNGCYETKINGCYKRNGSSEDSTEQLKSGFVAISFISIQTRQSWWKGKTVARALNGTSIMNSVIHPGRAPSHSAVSSPSNSTLDTVTHPVNIPPTGQPGFKPRRDDSLRSINTASSPAQSARQVRHSCIVSGRSRTRVRILTLRTS